MSFFRTVMSIVGFVVILMLISILDLLSPKHHKVLTPGKKYTGGKTFFKDEPGTCDIISSNVG